MIDNTLAARQTKRKNLKKCFDLNNAIVRTVISKATFRILPACRMKHEATGI
jgi:hypothetical protein